MIRIEVWKKGPLHPVVIVFTMTVMTVMTRAWVPVVAILDSSRLSSPFLPGQESLGIEKSGRPRPVHPGGGVAPGPNSFFSSLLPAPLPSVFLVRKRDSSSPSTRVKTWGGSAGGREGKGSNPRSVGLLTRNLHVG